MFRLQSRCLAAAGGCQSRWQGRQDNTIAGNRYPKQYNKYPIVGVSKDTIWLAAKTLYSILMSLLSRHVPPLCHGCNNDDSSCNHDVILTTRSSQASYSQPLTCGITCHTLQGSNGRSSTVHPLGPSRGSWPRSRLAMTAGISDLQRSLAIS